jgi:hypothetical protein
MSFELRACKTRIRLRKFHGPLGLLIARQARLNMLPHPSRLFIGTHKNYSLVDCPIYSVVKHRPRKLTACSSRLVAKSLNRLLSCPPRRVELLPTQCSAQLFSNRDTETVVALAPNIKLVVGRRLSVVGRFTPAEDRRLNLVELTGIEPVASWLQTRRSPS